MRVYVSSSYSDLQDYRATAIDQLRRMNFDATGMEYFATTATPPIDQCLAAVDASDIYVLLIGNRYGFIPSGYTKSITHIEYDRAMERGLPVLVFILADDVPVSPALIEFDEELRSHLRHFKNEVRTRQITRVVSSPDNFAASLAAALVRLKADRSVNTLAVPDLSELRRSRNEVQKLEEIVAAHRATIEQLQAKLAKVVPAEPIWRGRKFKGDDLLCFALLPFREEYFLVYESAVAPAAEANSLRALHAGEIFGTREVVEDIWDSICAARVVVVDVTGRNANVFYELGICHTLGKECIVITQDRNDVPFDIRHRRFIEYAPSRLTKLQHALKETIQAVLSSKMQIGDEAGDA